MGWGVSIITDMPIPLEVAEEIVTALPKDLRTHILGGEVSRQSWGWGALVDIALPEKERWAISGAHFSIEHAPAYTQALVKGLEDRGYSVRRLDYPEKLFSRKELLPVAPPVDWTRRFNFNDTVCVKLTPLGASIWAKHRPHFPPLDPSMNLAIQFWELAQIFGHHLGNGFPDVFVGTWFDIHRMVKPDGQ